MDSETPAAPGVRSRAPRFHATPALAEDNAHRPLGKPGPTRTCPGVHSHPPGSAPEDRLRSQRSPRARPPGNRAPLLRPRVLRTPHASGVPGHRQGFQLRLTGTAPIFTNYLWSHWNKSFRKLMLLTQALASLHAWLNCTGLETSWAEGRAVLGGGHRMEDAAEDAQLGHQCQALRGHR